MALFEKLKKPIFLIGLFFFFARIAFAESCPVCSSENDCNQRISCLTGQKKSLSSQIELIDTKISLTKVQINTTQEKINRINSDISSVSGRINLIEDSLAHVSTILANRIAATYIAGRSDPVLYLLTASDFKDFWQRLSYLELAQKHDKNLMLQMAQTKKNYNDQKDLLTQKKKQVETLSLQLKTYQAQMNQQNKEKQALLVVTQDELDRAVAQLASFQSFVSSQGGASLLSGQTKCDDWGCYYNQRDSSWGSIALNRTGYTLADSGCLVTSMAMAITHLGKKDVTPVTINSNSSNFAAYFPAYLNKTISAGGSSWTRVGISSSQIDRELSSGRSVVVGIGSGPSHFVLLVSGSNGDYLMNDPYVPNGQKIPFTSKYSLGSMTEIESIRQN